MTPAKTTRRVGTFTGFPSATFRFLSGLEKQNERDWFTAHRDDYDATYVEPALAFISGIGPKLSRISKTIRYEPRINGSLFRVNRDVRFSTDKTPYKPHIDLMFWEGDRKSSPAALFLRIGPRTVILGAGAHRFDEDQTRRYRSAVVDGRTGAALRRALDGIAAAGYEIGGARRKTMPRGFDKEHPRAKLLRRDGIYAELDGKRPRAIGSGDFVGWCLDHFTSMAPLHRWLVANL